MHSVIDLCNQLFPERGEALSMAWRTRQLQYTWLRALMTQYADFWQVTDEALQAAADSLQLDLTDGQREQLMDAYLALAPYPEVAQALGSLRAVPLAILSNGTPRMLQAALDSAGLGEFISQIFSVDTVKTYKPSPLVYQIATDKLGIAQRNIGFVSSNYWDIMGAAAFGFQTFWINRSAATPDRLGFEPQTELSRLTDLLEVLK